MGGNGHGGINLTKKCPYCGHNNLDRNRFCEQCGDPIDEKSVQRRKEMKLGLKVYGLLMRSGKGRGVIREMVKENPEEIRGIIEGK